MTNNSMGFDSVERLEAKIRGLQADLEAGRHEAESLNVDDQP